MLKRSYFAAANGYTGFRSYFDNIFVSEGFKRIFVLKGGPGTGKSTLMKRVADFAASEELDCDTIYCSSDPDSLDGVIVHTKRWKYAVIDGTAPHQRDAAIPGAIDIIINLGDNFDITLLESQRDEIVALNEKKKIAYGEAYSYLRTAGAINSKIVELIKKDFNYEKAEHIASTIESFTAAKGSNPKVALKRAFCKHGHFTLSDFIPTKQYFRIAGRHGEEKEFLKILIDKFGQGYDYVSFDPLSEQVPDVMIAGDVSYVCTSDSASEFDTQECLNKTISFEELFELEKMRDVLLSTAEKHFAEAAILHYELEDIYRNSIDFSKNDTILNRIISYIL